MAHEFSLSGLAQCFLDCFWEGSAWLATYHVIIFTFRFYSCFLRSIFGFWKLSLFTSSVWASMRFYSEVRLCAFLTARCTSKAQFTGLF